MNGDIPFQQIHYNNADEDFAKARAESDMENNITAKLHDRIWDPSDLNEPRKQSLDDMIKYYWERPKDQTFDDFFHFGDNLQKREYIYLDLNGGIPFQQLYFTKDDQDFAAARDEVDESLVKEATLQGGAQKDEDADSMVGKELAVVKKP